MTDIDRIIYLIDWNKTDSEQQLGITLAREVTCLKAFCRPIGPGYGKNVWENCAVILSERTDSELNPYLWDMLLWLEDLNWPGAETIQNRLIQFNDVHILCILMDKLVPALEKLNETSWLIFLRDLLENRNLKYALSENTVHILERAL